MKRILLATAATIALSLPAMAQGQQPADQNQNMQQPMDQNHTSQMNNQGGSSDMQQRTGQRISPSQLNQDQITQIQQALSQKGIDVKSDGKWGPETRAALRKFQQQNNLQGSGQLDAQTLAQLGVDLQGQSQGTVGSGSGNMNQGAGSMGRGSMGQGSGSSSGTYQNQPSPSGSGSGPNSQQQ